MPRYQDGTDIYREDFREALRWCLDLPQNNPPLSSYICSDKLMVEHTYHFWGGGCLATLIFVIRWMGGGVGWSDKS